jgi:predicted DNA-binding ribbon-helix-helix protein
LRRKNSGLPEREARFVCPASVVCGLAMASPDADMFASVTKMVHNVAMRTSITLDDDIHELASVYADARGITLGAAIGELIRSAQASARTESPIRLTRDGIPVFRSRGRVLTREMVKQAQEDDLE